MARRKKRVACASLLAWNSLPTTYQPKRRKARLVDFYVGGEREKEFYMNVKDLAVKVGNWLVGFGR